MQKTKRSCSKVAKKNINNIGGWQKQVNYWNITNFGHPKIIYCRTFRDDTRQRDGYPQRELGVDDLNSEVVYVIKAAKPNKVNRSNELQVGVFKQLTKTIFNLFSILHVQITNSTPVQGECGHARQSNIKSNRDTQCITSFISYQICLLATRQL